MNDKVEETTWDRLKDTLAQVRMAEFLQKKRNEYANVTEMSAEKMKAELEAMQFEIYRDIFKDTQGADKERVRATSKEHAQQRGKAREAINRFVDQLVDANGKPKEVDAEAGHDHLASIFAKFYADMKAAHVFDADSRRVLDTMVTCVSQLPALQEAHETSVDFRRLSQDEIELLNRVWQPERIDTRALEKVFQAAFNKGRDTGLHNSPALKNTSDNPIAFDEKHPFPAWPDKRVLIEGIPFLQHKAGDESYLLTVNGGMIPEKVAKKEITDQLVMQGKLISELKFTPEQYLDVDSLKDKPVIDGFECESGAPLLCLDVDLRTGLRPSNHKEFMDFVRSQLPTIAARISPHDEKEQEKAVASGWTRLADDAYANALMDIAEHQVDKAHLKHICKLACAHIKRVVAQLDNNLTTQIEGKTTATKPLLVISMGGAGSGKGGAKEMIMNASSGNFVTASLDDFRKCSDVYKVLQAANHHADDYGVVEPFANTMRDWVKDEAIKKNYNLLYDGTSIPFLSRYKDILRDAKSKGYQVVVAAYDTMLVAADPQKKIAGKTALERVVSRFEQEKEKRALPWSVVTGKHIKLMPSLLEAFGSDQVDRLMVFCKDGQKGRDYLLAEAFSLAAEAQKPTGAANEAMFNKLRASAPAVPDAVNQALQEGLAKIPEVSLDKGDNNKSYLVKSTGDNSRVMLIHNNIRFTQLAEKALLNPYASSAQGMLHKPQALAAVSNPISDMAAAAVEAAKQIAGTVLNVVRPPDAYLQAVSSVCRGNQPAIVPEAQA